MREMIVSKDVDSRRVRALNKLLPMQRSDFKGIYKAMGGRPVTIRFLDPPLHEFLPDGRGGHPRACQRDEPDLRRAVPAHD